MAKKKEYEMPKNLETGDIVLYRAATGKVWKVCKVLRHISYTREVKEYVDLTNLRAKGYSRFRAYPKYGDIIFKVPNDTNIETADIGALITLYAPAEIQASTKGNKFFKPSTNYNIQINSTNKNKIEELIKVAKQAGIGLRKIGSSNVNLDAKYVLED